MARFAGMGKVIAKMSNGEEMEIIALLTCEGDYNEYWENPIGEPWCSKICYPEQDVDLTTVNLYDPEEYTPQIEGVKVEKVLKIIDEPDWELIE